jgi:hypothetical protein
MYITIPAAGRELRVASRKQFWGLPDRTSLSTVRIDQIAPTRLHINDAYHSAGRRKGKCPPRVDLPTGHYTRRSRSSFCFREDTGREVKRLTGRKCDECK